ncbi:MAG: hypothetical protein V4736_06105 [Bdellovibrionota bacterium]
MFSLRKIIFSLLSLFVFQNAFAQGVLSTVVSQAGKTNAGFESEERPGYTQTQITAQSPKFLKNHQVSLITTISKLETSDVNLLQKDGSTKKLSESYDGSEVSADLEWRGFFAEYQVALRGGKTLFGQASVCRNCSSVIDSTESPYARTSWGADFQKTFYNQTSVLGTKYNHQDMNQPESYFTNRALQTERRPERLTEQGWEAYYEQMWTSIYKTRLALLGGRKSQERPGYTGAELRHMVVLLPRVSARLDTGMLSEKASQAHNDSRGKFDVVWAEPSLIFEPVYDWTITAGYGFVQETETERQDERELRTGTDIYSLGTEYHDSGLKWVATARWTDGNTDQKNFFGSGGVEWTY